MGSPPAWRAHLGVPVLWVRAAFVVTAALGGAGVAMYAGLWMVLPTDSQFASGAPGAREREPARRRDRAGCAASSTPARPSRWVRWASA